MGHESYMEKCIAKNPYEGKKVVFIEDENDPENADGKRGHLKAVGDTKCRETFYEAVVKRRIDVVFSLGILLVLSPVFLVTSIVIFIDDPGPVIFTQKRIGKNKKYFNLYKFRSMKMNTPHDKPTHMLEDPDQYHTRIGRFIRKYSIDELPQFYNVLISDMSVIGPRPALWNQDALVAERDRYGANSISPGITGRAQICGRDKCSLMQKAKMDGEYARVLKRGGFRAFFNDCRLLFGTIEAVFKHEGLVEGKTGSIDKDNIHS